MIPLQFICGICGVALIPVCIAVIFFTHKHFANDFGSVLYRVPKYKKLRLVLGIMISFLFPVSCFIREWGIFFSFAVSALGVGYASYLFYSIIILRKNGIYENGFVLELISVKRCDIELLTVDESRRCICVQKKDRTQCEIMVPPQADFEIIRNLLTSWECDSFSSDL